MNTTFKEFKESFETVPELREEWYEVDNEESEFLGYMHFENEEELKEHYQECINNDLGFDVYNFSTLYTDGTSYTIFNND